MTFIYWRIDDTILISEGHHRMNAALELGEERGDWGYVEQLLSHAVPDSGSPPQVTSRLPRRSWWRRWHAWFKTERKHS